MLAHSEVPFDQVVSEELACRDVGRNPFFDIIFNFDNAPPAASWPPELDVRTEHVDLGASRFDLALSLQRQTDGIVNCRFEYSLDLFEPATIELLAAHFRVLLERVADIPDDVLIADLPIADAAEYAAITDVWSRSSLVCTNQPPVAEAIHELIASTAAGRPNAVALIEDGSEALTYAQLDQRANQLAHLLRAQGVTRDVRVGIYLERSIGAVVAMLATLKAGGAYVPLDPAYPLERTAYMLAIAGVGTIVAVVARAWEPLVNRHGAAPTFVRIFSQDGF